MATGKHSLGTAGEILVIRSCTCPRCKRPRTLRRLGANFKCADIICDFCGYTAQVKTASTCTAGIPSRVLGAGWAVQEERMKAGIYLPLFLVQIESKRQRIAYLSADLQQPGMFKPRTPLSPTAHRAGWQGFLYVFTEEQKKLFVILLDTSAPNVGYPMQYGY